jgi:hypothetical protein
MTPIDILLLVEGDFAEAAGTPWTPGLSVGSFSLFSLSANDTLLYLFLVGDADDEEILVGRDPLSLMCLLLEEKGRGIVNRLERRCLLLLLLSALVFCF